MERKIIFRGKSIINGKWLHGDLLGNEEGKFAIVQPFKVNMDNECSCCEVDEDTIGQFTGLYDQNKTEIYEGDILRSVKFEDIVMFVVYDEEEASFMAVLINKNIGTELETRCHITQEWLDKRPKVVIGNIHDNKDLLNKE